MINFMILFLGLFWLQETAQAQDFQPPVQENAFSELLRLEEKLLPELDAFVAKKEDYLKELDKIIHQTEILKKPSNKSVQSFLGTPLNQYFLLSDLLTIGELSTIIFNLILQHMVSLRLHVFVFRIGQGNASKLEVTGQIMTTD